MIRALVLGCLLATSALAVAAPAAAQPEDPEQVDPAEDRAATFQRVEGPVTEDVPGGPLLIGAYGIIWLLIMLYVLRIGLLQARTARDVTRLERSVAAAEKK